MSRIIVGLVGRKRVGKGTIAAQLVEKHGYTELAFADAVRGVMYRADPFVSVDPPVRWTEALDTLGYEEAKTVYPEVRRLLQGFGHDGIRTLDPEFWVNQLVKSVEAVPGDGPIVISDVRYRNELDTIARLNGYTAHVMRPIYDERVLFREEHRSEGGLDTAVTDYTVWNDASISHLKTRADLLHAKLENAQRIGKTPIRHAQ